MPIFPIYLFRNIFDSNPIIPEYFPLSKFISPKSSDTQIIIKIPQNQCLFNFNLFKSNKTNNPEIKVKKQII